MIPAILPSLSQRLSSALWHSKKLSFADLIHMAFQADLGHAMGFTVGGLQQATNNYRQQTAALSTRPLACHYSDPAWQIFLWATL